MTQYDFVVLDDIGRESYNTDRKKEIAFRVIDILLNYEIITCFSANPEMIERLKAMPEQKAMLDRLKDICPNKLIFKGESLRGLAIKKKQNKIEKIARENSKDWACDKYGQKLIEDIVQNGSTKDKVELIKALFPNDSK